MSLVYDAGMLVAAERGDRDAWAIHRAALEDGVLPITTAPIVAQVSRSPRQARLHRLLDGCQTAAFAADMARAVGALVAAAGTSDVVDGHLMFIAASTRSTVITTDVDDLEALAAQLPVRLRIVSV